MCLKIIGFLREVGHGIQEVEVEEIFHIVVYITDPANNESFRYFTENSDRIFVKFSYWRDCRQLFSVKNGK